MEKPLKYETVVSVCLCVMQSCDFSGIHYIRCVSSAYFFFTEGIQHKHTNSELNGSMVVLHFFSFVFITLSLHPFSEAKKGVELSKRRVTADDFDFRMWKTNTILEFSLLTLSVDRNTKREQQQMSYIGQHLPVVP